MTRGLTTQQQQAAAAGHRAIAALIDIAFASGTLSLAIGPSDIVVGAQTYFATGQLLNIERVRESASSREGLQFILSGLDPTIVVIANQEAYRGKIVRLLKAFFDPDTNIGIGSPNVTWIGRIRAMQTSDDNSQAAVTVMAEHFETELTRASPTRLNDADQQRFFPGDLGCQYAEETVNKDIVFPSKEALRR